MSPVEQLLDADRTIARVAARQYGLITANQLRDAGMDRNAVARRVQRRRLQRLYPRVYAVGPRRTDLQAAWLAAVLAAGDGAALSHLAAARHMRLWRRGTRGIHVVARGTPAALRGSAVRVHRTRIESDEIWVVEGIPVTCLARTLVDLCAVVRVGELVSLLSEADFLGVLKVEEVVAAMHRHSRRRDLERLEQALERFL